MRKARVAISKWRVGTTLIWVVTTCRLLLATCAFAAFSDKDVGTSGAQFLKIGPGARPAAMGEAFAAMADDIHALYYNPAGLGSLRHVQFGFMHNEYFQGLDYNFAAIAVPVARFKNKLDAVTPENSGGVLGLAVYNLAIADIQRRGLADTALPSGTFGASDSAYALSYARRLSDQLSAGVTGKVIVQKIDDQSASSFALDAGSQYRSGPAAAAFGVRNLGTAPKFDRKADPLPLVVYLGGSRRFKDRLTLALDITLPRDNDPQGSLGAEYAHPFTDNFSASLRAGYYTRNTDPSGLSGLSAGAGLSYKSMAFDFAWVPFGDLGNTFRYSLLLKF